MFVPPPVTEWMVGNRQPSLFAYLRCSSLMDADDRGRPGCEICMAQRREYDLPSSGRRNGGILVDGITLAFHNGRFASPSYRYGALVKFNDVSRTFFEIGVDRDLQIQTKWYAGLR